MNKMLLVVMVLSFIGCTHKAKKEGTPVVKVEKVEAPKLLKDVESFDFNGACWDTEAKSNGFFYVESFSLIYVADTSIGIFTKDKAPDVLPPTCILEATEKEKNVPVKDEVVSFSCFFGDNIVEGQYYNFVQRLSNDMIWLVNLEDGQNVILPRALCQIYPAVKPVFN